MIFSRSNRGVYTPLAIHIVTLAVAILISGCKSSGPASTQTNSSGFPTVTERAKFLHQYVKFRRTYETLDFDISFLNGDGMAPGPSEWDIRIVATVPESEVQDWVPAGVSASTAPNTRDTEWLRSVPTTLDLSGVSEWYVEGNRVVGIDRARRIVVYRNSAS
jgi:hypothetical protein